MTRFAVAGIAASLLLVLPARLVAQEHGDKPAAKSAAKPAAPPAKPAAPPAAKIEQPSRGPVIAPAKPIVAPGIGSRSDVGAMPAPARSANAKTISVSARQAAEQTIAALVAAMKSMPKRPPAPPESRTPRARSADGGTAAQGHDAPTPILSKVTWPATPPELGLDRRVELDWHGDSAGAARLRWNEPSPD